MDLSPQRRSQIVLRFDAGFGTDANFNWVLWRGYQVVGKSYHGKRAGKLAGLVREWTEVGAAHWVAACPQPVRYGVSVLFLQDHTVTTMTPSKFNDLQT